MRLIICTTACLALASSPANLAAKPSQFHLNETTWTFVDPGQKVKAIESIDASGNYIENAASGKHLDHGTAVMKDGKACFTSAMTEDGEMCWTTRPTRIGQTMKTANGKGEKLTVTRAAYKPLTMPK